MSNKYKEAIKLVLEFLEPINELAAQPSGTSDILVRQLVINDLKEWREWITEDDDGTDASGTIGDWTSANEDYGVIIDPDRIVLSIPEGHPVAFLTGISNNNKELTLITVNRKKEESK